MVDTIKFSEMASGGDLPNNSSTPGLLSGNNVLFNNPWTFLPPGGTGDRPVPSAEINYRLRFNTDLKLYEYYDASLGDWTQLQETLFTAGPYVIYKSDPAFPDAQNIGLLSSGLLKQTVSLGISTISIAINGTDYWAPGDALTRTQVPSVGSDVTNKTYVDNAISGAIAGAVLLSPASDQTITAHSLIISDGNLQVGSSGHAGFITSYPAVALEGVLVLGATSNSAGNFNTTITNNTSVGQSQIVTIPDSGAANAKFILSSSTTDQTITTNNLIISQGSVQAGSSGHSGFFASFPAAASSGTLNFAATTNSAGNFSTTVTNAASIGQSQVIRIPDSGGSTANFTLAPSSLVSGNLVKASGTAGLLVDAGFPATSLLTWNAASSTPITAVVNNGYYITNAAQVTITLPVTAAAGSIVAIAGNGAGGWVLAPGAGQTIKVIGSSASTSITSAEQYDCIEVICTVANTTWVSRSLLSTGLTIV